MERLGVVRSGEPAPMGRIPRWLPESSRSPAATEMQGFAMNKHLPNNAVKTYSKTALETVFLMQMPTERYGKTLSAAG